MCLRYFFEDECPFYPDCASCYDPDSIDYMWRDDEKDNDCCGSCLSCDHSKECMEEEVIKHGLV